MSGFRNLNPTERNKPNLHSNDDDDWDTGNFEPVTNSNPKTIDLEEESNFTADRPSQDNISEILATKIQFQDARKTSKPEPVPQQNTTRQSNDLFIPTIPTKPAVLNQISTFVSHQLDNDTFINQPLLNNPASQSTAERFEQNSPNTISPSSNREYNYKSNYRNQAQQQSVKESYNVTGKVALYPQTTAKPISQQSYSSNPHSKTSVLPKQIDSPQVAKLKNMEIPIQRKLRSFGSHENLSQKGSNISLSGVDCTQLAQKFPCFNASQISAFNQEFLVALDGNDTVHYNELASVSTKTGHSFNQVVEALQNMNLTSNSGHVTFDSFLTAVASLRSSHVNQSESKKITLGGTHENTTHTINFDEKDSFVTFLNEELEMDKDVSYRLPIDPLNMDIFTQVRDGVLLAKLVNKCCPGTIDERVLNLGRKLSPFQMVENLNCVINSCKAIGCSVVNIGAQDLMTGKEHLILGLIWQIIRAGLTQKIDIKVHPELFRLLEPGETLEQFLKLPTDQILMRWFNYHLKRAGWHGTVSNFNSDVKDGKNYTVLLNQLSSSCSMSPLQTSDLFTRAEMVLQNADKLHCRKYLTPKTLVSGNSKLNFAFVANLFNSCPGLDPLNETEKAAIDDWLFGSDGDREARAFSLWLNSLGVEPFVHNLYDCVADGTILLQAIQHIRPDLVNASRINKSTQSRFKMVENTNYLIEIGKELNFSLVGIQGSDITDGVKILVLGYVWQLMREHIIQTLKTLGKRGKDVTEADIIEWANSIVKKNGKQSAIRSFKDGSLRTGIFFLDILNSMRPGVVDYNAIQRGDSDDACKMNAKYAISIARKLGATIFLLPEDIVEVKPKMILTFVGTLMALDNSV